MDFEENNIYAAAEASANVFNLKMLVFMAILTAFSELLNDLGLFWVQRSVMLPVVLLSSSLFLILPAVWLVHDRLLRKYPTMLGWRSLKIWIIVFAYLGISLLCIALSFHAVLLMIVPPLMAAQYRCERTMSVCILLVTVLLVPVSVYGSFFLGLPDRNFIKHMLTDEEAFHIANRVQLATSRRMVEIALHYVLPRLLGVILTDVLAVGIARRNAWMLDCQNALAQKANHEMQRRNSLQGQVIEDLAGVIETRDIGTGEHVVRTKKYVGMIAHARDELILAAKNGSEPSEQSATA